MAQSSSTGGPDTGDVFLDLGSSAFVNELASDGESLYAGNADALTIYYRIPLATGVPQTLWTASSGYFEGLALDEDALYFTDAGEGPMRLPKTGGTPIAVGELGVPFFGSPVLASGRIFWNEQLETSHIFSIGTNGSGPLTLASGEYPAGGLATDGARIYWLSVSGEARAVDAGGGSVTTITSGFDYAVSMTVDDAFIYVADGAKVLRAPKTGGPPELIATGQYRALPLIVDDTWVWFLDTQDAAGDDAIRRVPKGGGAMETVHTTDHHLTALTEDAHSVYWAEEGLIKRMAK